MTRDERIDQLVAESIAAQPDGCCGGPEWRGRLCQYHQGFEDGAEAAMRSFDEFNDPPERASVFDRLEYVHTPDGYRWRPRNV